MIRRFLAECVIMPNTDFYLLAHLFFHEQIQEQEHPFYSLLKYGMTFSWARTIAEPLLVNPFKLNVHLLKSAQNVGLIRQLFAESVIMCF